VFWKEVYCTDIGKKNANGKVVENGTITVPLFFLLSLSLKSCMSLGK